MRRSTRIVTGLLVCAAPLLLGAGKPAPTPAAPFVPALAYKYGSQDIRLANMDGSQAVLLVRSPTGTQPLWLALAPLSMRQVAYITSSDGVRSLRLASWTQQASGGPLSVTVDPTPLITTSPASANLVSLDYSPDGTRLAVLATDFEARTELRFFDIATRDQVGETIALAQVASALSWRSSDNSILLRGTNGMSSFKDGLQTPLFGGNQTSEFDAFTGASTEVLLPYKDYLVPGNSIQRWDGVSMSGATPILTKVADGIFASLSCDNARVIFTELGAKRLTYILTLASGAKTLFSKDSNVQRMEYPSSCN